MNENKEKIYYNRKKALFGSSHRPAKKRTFSSPQSTNQISSNSNSDPDPVFTEPFKGTNNSAISSNFIKSKSSQSSKTSLNDSTYDNVSNSFTNPPLKRIDQVKYHPLYILRIHFIIRKTSR